MQRAFSFSIALNFEFSYFKALIHLVGWGRTFKGKKKMKFILVSFIVLSLVIQPSLNLIFESK